MAVASSYMFRNPGRWQPITCPLGMYRILWTPRFYLGTFEPVLLLSLLAPSSIYFLSFLIFSFSIHCHARGYFSACRSEDCRYGPSAPSIFLEAFSSRSTSTTNLRMSYARECQPSLAQGLSPLITKIQEANCNISLFTL